jgi:hypothetical protein
MSAELRKPLSRSDSVPLPLRTSCGLNADYSILMYGSQRHSWADATAPDRFDPQGTLMRNGFRKVGTLRAMFCQIPD